MMKMSSIADALAENLPTREDVINAIGLASRRSAGAEMAGAMTIFGAGLLVGAGLALLFAPASGEELRRGLADRLGMGGEESPRAGRSGLSSRRTGVAPA